MKLDKQLSQPHDWQGSRCTSCVSCYMSLLLLGGLQQILAYLILDEGEQRADHQGHTFSSQGWQLVAQ